MSGNPGYIPGPKAVWKQGVSDKTMAGLCEQFDLHPNQITEWKLPCVKPYS